MPMEFVPNQEGTLEAYYNAADAWAQHLGIDPAQAQDLATETIATKVAYVCMYNEAKRLQAERLADEYAAPDPRQHKLAEYAPQEGGALVGIYNAVIARQSQGELGGA